MNTDGINLLAVGIGSRLEALAELPVSIHPARTASDALRLLRNRRMDAILSRWDLDDRPGGLLLKNIMAARPGMPAVAVVGPGDYPQEVAARGLGLKAVLNDDDDDGYFCETVMQVLDLGTTAASEPADCRRLCRPVEKHEPFQPSVHTRSAASRGSGFVA